MEPENQNNQPVEVTTQSQPVTESDKMSKKGIIGMVILTVVALAGVAFGIWGMVGKDQAEKDLAIKITEAGGKVTDFVTDKITSIDEDGTVTEITDTNVTTSSVNTEDYIYVGEWGLKIKIPEGLKKVSYAFRQFDGDATMLWLWGNIDDRLPDFANPSVYSNGLGVVSRYLISSLSNDQCGDAIGEYVLTKGDYNYCYSHPQALYSTGDEEMGSEKRAVEIIEEMLTNQDNYSAI